MQLFVSDKGFLFVVPMKYKSKFSDALNLFAKEIGVSTQLIIDPLGEQLSNKSKEVSHGMGLDMRWLEESKPCNEIYIGILKAAIRQDLLK